MKVKSVLFLLFALVVVFCAPSFITPLIAQDEETEVVEPADESEDEVVTIFVCPKCGYEAEEAGQCPTCDVPLIEKTTAATDDAGDTDEPDTTEED